MKNESLLIPIFMGMSYRNIITSGVIDEVEDNYDVTYITFKDSQIDYILRNKNKKVVSFKIGIFQKILRKIFLPLEKLQLYSFYQKHKTKTLDKYIKRDRQLFLFFLYFNLSKILGKFYGKYDFFSSHYPLFLPRKIRSLIALSNYILVLSSDDPIDKAILKTAYNKSTYSTLLIHSWDNLPARGFFSASPNRVLVWNEVMKQQAVELHGISSDSISIIGVPQFFGYKKFADMVDRKFFYETYGLEKGYKVITYTCSASRVFPDEPLFIEYLIDIMRNEDVYIIIRLHPTERISQYISFFSGIEKVIIDEPSGNFAAKVNDKISDSKEDIYKFISLMKYSDVVINLASTISLDAIIFDSPVICIAFNIDSSISKSSWNNAKEWYKSTHYDFIVKSGAISIVTDKKQLYECISRHIENPDFGHKQRCDLSRFFCNYDFNVKHKLVNSLHD
ncbi:hypothetical protein GTG28_16100 [Vibrio sp. OCN044]|uniref:Uncharacterized protein n=1 Tax=Vibrio tetraodonis subsp. pristinus TaxID=2695891 RepID=A0A6L8M4L4_9VIBR|nr:hypothetical protein [Vibrio tetraodonis]MYM60752.1 hypothetical protein [Vibrio tetraodonis subsp. pristinus]